MTCRQSPPPQVRSSRSSDTTRCERRAGEIWTRSTAICSGVTATRWADVRAASRWCPRIKCRERLTKEQAEMPGVNGRFLRSEAVSWPHCTWSPKPCAQAPSPAQALLWAHAVGACRLAAKSPCDLRKLVRTGDQASPATSSRIRLSGAVRERMAREFRVYARAAQSVDAADRGALADGLSLAATTPAGIRPRAQSPAPRPEGRARFAG